MLHLRRLLVVLTVTSSLYAQRSDLGLWTTFSVNKDIGDKLVFNFDQEFRVRDNLTTVNLFYTNVGLTYKFNKNFRVAGTYRIINKHKEDGFWGIRHRVYADVIARLKPGRFIIAYRSRLQYEWRGYGYAAQFGYVPESYWRNLFKCSFKLNELFSPYIGTEMRWLIHDPRVAYHKGFDRTRFIGGVDYSINKMHQIGFYGLYQKEWNISDPETLYIIGVEYTINID
jgi:hypothetical protein